MHTPWDFRHIAFLALFLPFFANAQIFVEQEDHLPTFSKYLELESNPLVVPGRYRIARMDRSEVLRSLEHKVPLVFNLFNDVEIRANAQKVKELASESTFVSGDLADGGHFTLFLHKSGIIRGEMHSIQGTYTLKSEGEDFNQVLIKQEDLSDVTLCGNEAEGMMNNNVIPAKAGIQSFPSKQFQPHFAPASDNVIPVKAGISAKQGTNNTIDVLVVYTQRVEDHEGGPQQIRAAIENEISKMNQVLENSGLVHRQVTLAGMEKVDYEQTGDHMGVDLFNLIRTSEDNRNNKDYSALDEVHPLIEKYQADLVHLFVRDTAVVCGIAELNYNLRQDNRRKQYCENSDNYDLCLFNRRRQRWKELNNYFSVSSVKCISSYSFTHELGHLFGLWHQRNDVEWRDSYVEDGLMPFKPYAFGYVSPDFSQKICQSTIMSSKGCPPEGIDYYTMIPYFSNPDLFFPRPDGEYASRPFNEETPMGVPGDEYTVDLDGPVNAARAIDDVWDIVATLSEPGDIALPGVSTCSEGDIPSNALNLSSKVSLSPTGETRNIMISFPVPDNCAGISLSSSSSASFVSTSVQKVRDGEYELSITASSNNSSCNSRSAQVTVEIRGVSGVSPGSLSVTQESSNTLCKNISDLPLDSTSLDLSGQNTSSSFRLANGAFSRFVRLVGLNLGHNRLRAVDGALFDGLDRLRVLDLGHNQLQEIPSFASSVLGSLESLKLNGNLIGGTVAAGSLAGLASLERLSLASNRIAGIHGDAFSDVPGLTHLWLHGNKIDELPGGVFSHLTDLRELGLSRNRLDKLPDLSGSVELSVLWLSGNKFASLPASTFSGLSKLATLGLSRNQLTEVPELSDLPALESLWLHSNRIAALSRSDLSGLSSLRGLDLGRNQIGQIDDGAFSGLSELKRLRLNGNGIAALSPSTFDGLSAVEFLTLSRNRITNLPNRAFSAMPNLRQLWLHSNQIQSIAPDAFAGLSRLEYLNLSHNPLSGPLPNKVCAFIKGVPKVHLNGIDMNAICP